MHIGMILRPGLEHDELNQLIKKDFDDDTQDKEVKNKDGGAGDGEDHEGRPYGTYDYIDERKLFDSIFELTDTWVPSINELEYKSFLDQLTFRLKYSNQQNNSAYDVLPWYV